MLNIKSENSRSAWKKEETMHLLALMKEYRVMDLLDGKTRRNKNVYMLLSQELTKKGFNKISEQVKLKFRTLKNQFMKTKRNNGKSGAGRQSMNYYDELEELLGSRPVATAIGLDSTLVEEMLEVAFEDGVNDEASGAVCESMEEDDVADGSLASGSQQDMEKPRNKKRSAVQLTLLEIAADVKESQQKISKVFEEESATFLAEQRRLHEDYLKATKELMAEDRRETRAMLLEILNK